MSPSRLAALAALALPCLSAPLTAQIRHPGDPASPRLIGPVPTIDVPAPDVEPLLIEDELSTVDGRFRFGVLVDAPLDLTEVGEWDVTNDGERLASPKVVPLGALRTLRGCIGRRGPSQGAESSSDQS